MAAMLWIGRGVYVKKGWLAGVLEIFSRSRSLYFCLDSFALVKATALLMMVGGKRIRVRAGR